MEDSSFRRITDHRQRHRDTGLPCCYCTVGERFLLFPFGFNPGWPGLELPVHRRHQPAHRSLSPRRASQNPGCPRLPDVRCGEHRLVFGRRIARPLGLALGQPDRIAISRRSPYRGARVCKPAPQARMNLSGEMPLNNYVCFIGGGSA